MASSAGPNRVISRNVSPAFDALAIGEGNYWTPERMAAAVPVELVVGNRPPARDRGPQEFSEAAVRREDSWRPAGIPAANIGLSSVPSSGFAAAPVTQTGHFPYTAIGKLFMTFGGRDEVGSAWVVGERAIMTAAHCVYRDRGAHTWARNVQFVPRHSAGAAPAGTWSAVSLHTLQGWADREADMADYDVAGAVLDRPIRGVTGTVGWIANRSESGPFQAVGYPKSEHGTPYDGDTMWRCNARRVADATLRMGSDLPGGASGGPWLVRDGSGVYAAGLNSHRRAGDGDTLRSPNFAAGFLNLIDALT
jgi:V8-like Glu-specific endopeptidase